MHKGHCLCGAVTWTNTGSKTRNLNCHCDECRRGVAGAFSAVAGMEAATMKIEGPWKDYRYTPDSSRAFCEHCGTRIWFQSDLWADEIFLNVGALDDPAAHVPDQHVMARQAVPWAVVADGIPVSDGFQVDLTVDPPQTDKDETENAGLAGRCLCGDVTWETNAAPIWSGHCHCDSCRRATGAPFASFFGAPRNSVKWSGDMTEFASSDGQVKRCFCANCGTHMTYEYDGWPDETHLYAASLIDPADFQPQAHFHYAEKLSWVEIADKLPRYPGSAETENPLI